jgi:O-antigen ligase
MKTPQLTKINLASSLVLISIVPWFSGGRLPIALLISAASLFLAAFWLWRGGEMRRLNGRHPLIIGAVGYIAWSALSLVWSVNRFESLVWLLTLGLAAAVFGLSYQLQFFAAARQRLVTGVVSIATLSSLYGFWLFLAEDYERLTSSFYWANPFAAFLIPAIGLAAWRYHQSHRLLWLAVTSLNLAAFLLADSRTGIATRGLMVVVAVGRGWRNLKWRQIGLVVAFTVVLVGGITGVRTRLLHRGANLPGARFAEAASGESTSGSERVNFLRASWDIGSDHPWLGTGGGTFKSVHPAYQVGPNSAASHPHNFYAQTFAETGLVGASLSLFWLAGVLWLLYRSRKEGGWFTILSGGALALHLGLDIDSRYPALLFLLALLLGLSYPRDEGRSRLAAGWLILPLLLMLPAALNYQQASSAAIARGFQMDARYSEAASYLEPAISRLAYDPDRLTELSINYFALASSGLQSDQNLRRAAQLTEVAIKQDAWDAQHYFLRARLLREQRQWDASRSAYQEALRRDPWNHPEYYHDLIQLEITQGRLSEARAWADRILSAYPDEVLRLRSVDRHLPRQLADVLVDRAVLLLRAGEPQAAQRDLTRAIRLDPDSLRAQRLRHP